MTPKPRIGEKTRAYIDYGEEAQDEAMEINE
jgi:hypothetical protein